MRTTNQTIVSKLGQVSPHCWLNPNPDRLGKFSECSKDIWSSWCGLQLSIDHFVDARPSRKHRWWSGKSLPRNLLLRFFSFRPKPLFTEDHGKYLVGPGFIITGYHNYLDIIWLVKMVKYIGFMYTIGPLNYGPP